MTTVSDVELGDSFKLPNDSTTFIVIGWGRFGAWVIGMPARNKTWVPDELEVASVYGWGDQS